MDGKKITDDELRKAAREYHNATDEGRKARSESRETQKTLEDLMAKCGVNAIALDDEVIFKSPLYDNIMIIVRARCLASTDLDKEKI